MINNFFMMINNINSIFFDFRFVIYLLLLLLVNTKYNK